MSKIEDVARVLLEHDGEPRRRWEYYIPAARAVIEAMRKPTERMVDGGYLHRKTLEEAWTLMIDAALSERGMEE
jgi:hypothetical protein